MVTIKESFDKHGSDKALHHAYHHAYGSLLPDRDAVKMVMEVGITDGGSMLAWREIFQSAHVVGLDIEPSALQPGPRLEVHLGSQADRGAVLRAATNDGREPERRFDLIVEDAAHRLEYNLLTLFWLWPYLKPGGLYVIEEMQDVNSYEANVGLFRGGYLLHTDGPYGGDEPLVVIRKEP